MRRIRAAIAVAIGLGALGCAGAAWAQIPYYSLIGPAPGASACPGGLCQDEALRRSLDALRYERSLRILQIGDSHTAGGRITAAMQARLQARNPAVAVETRGEVGAGYQTLEMRTDAGLVDMLRATRPDLIILAYGVNDGFEPDITRTVFEARMTAQLRRLRRLAPGAEMLVLGAPEGLNVGRGRPCGPDGHGAPDTLPMVRDVQRRVAAREGVAFWDWFGRMGGACSAERLATDPRWGAAPLMRADRVHFTPEGADWIGRMLAEDLIAAAGRGGAR